MGKEHDIFISYSRKDSALVLSIARTLHEEGYSVWIDKTGIESGDEFKSVIAEAIRESKVFVFFSSYAANKSPWTIKEVNTAVHLNKTIIPIKLDNTEYNESLLLDLSGLDYISYNDNPNIGLQKLLRALKKHTNNQGLQYYDKDLTLPNIPNQFSSASQGNKAKSYMIIAAIFAALAIGYFIFGNKDDNNELITTVPTEQTVAKESVSSTVSANSSVARSESDRELRTEAPMATTKEVRTGTESKIVRNPEIATSTPPVTTPTTLSQAVPEQSSAPTATMSDAELVAQGKKAMRAMDYNKAKSYLTLAANHGSTEATYQLGMLYSNSNYDGYNRETATNYFVKAAKNNHVEAMYQAGMMYLGVDNSTAKMWFIKASDNGHAKADSQLSKLK